MKALTTRNPNLVFFALAFLFTWLILGPGVVTNLGLVDFRFDGTVVTILGGLGPFLAALTVTWITEGREGAIKIFRNIFSLKAKVRWWAASVLLLAGLFALAAGSGGLAGMPGPDPAAGVYLGGGHLLAVIALLLSGSFAEEVGWRGFALPRLQRQYKPMRATVILTLVWWLWHLPSYWTLPLAMEAVQQFGFVPAFGIQFIVLLALGTLCAWVYNGSGGKVIMPVLLHAGWNFWSGAFGQDAAMFLLPLFLVTAIIVGLVTKGRLGFMADERSGMP